MLHCSYYFAEGLLARHLIQGNPAFDHFQLQQVGEHTFYIESLEDPTAYEVETLTPKQVCANSTIELIVGRCPHNAAKSNRKSFTGQTYGHQSVLLSIVDPS